MNDDSRTWIARVEWDADVEPAEADMDAMMDRLVGRGPAVAHEPDGAWSLTLTVNANTLRQAIAAAIADVEAAVGAKATGVEVLTEGTYDTRVESPTLPDLIGYAEIADMLGVSRQRAAQLASNPGFPAAVVTTKAGPLRVKSSVEAWAKTWARSPGRPAKAVSVASEDGRGDNSSTLEPSVT